MTSGYFGMSSSFLVDLVRDVRHGIRYRRRKLGLTLLAIATLGLGIGLNTALFAAYRAVFDRRPAVTDPEELVYVYDITGSAIDLGQLRATGSTIGEFSSHELLRTVLHSDGRDIRVNGEIVPTNYFDVLQIPPSRGRTFRESDVNGADLAVVLSDHLWTTGFGSADVAGLKISLEGRPATVIGVAPKTFRGLVEPWNQTEIWVIGRQYYGALYKDYSPYVIARLDKGVSALGLRSFLANQPAQQGTASKPIYFTLPIDGTVLPFEPDQAKAGPVQAVARALAIVGVLVLLTAAVNIVGILLAHGLGRATEFSLRQMLGAGQRRVFQQVIVENLLLTSAGAVSGVLLAAFLIGLYRRLAPVQYSVDLHLDLISAVFLVVLSVCLGLVVGLGPALQGSKVTAGAGIDSMRPGSGSAQSGTIRYSVVVPQAAFSIILLLLAMTYVGALLGVDARNVGYDITRPLKADVARAPGSNGAVAAAGTAYYDTVLRRIRALDSVASAGVTTVLPLAQGPTPMQLISSTGGLPTHTLAARAYVSDGYLRAMGIPLVAGRDFDERDRSSGPVSHVIVSQAVARALWPRGDAVGSRFSERAGSLGSTDPNTACEVIGVAGDVRPLLGSSARPFVYRPLGEMTSSVNIPVHLVVTGGVARGTLATDLNQALRSSDASAEVLDIQEMSDAATRILLPLRAAAWLLGCAGIAGMVMALIGVYGVVSHCMAQELPAIGIRKALGATRWQITGSVLRRGLYMAAMALVPGILLGMALLRVGLRLTGSAPMPNVFLLVCVPTAMSLAILVACYVPAHRASALDPMSVLRKL